MKSLLSHINESFAENVNEGKQVRYINYSKFSDETIIKAFKKFDVNISTSVARKRGDKLIDIQAKFSEKETDDLEDYLEEINESFSINEEKEITSDSEFKSYAKKVLKEMHGDDYDDGKANDTITGILKEAGDDYGAAIGMLTKD